jgi:uncharacterized phage protein (TIGR01671 family)
MREIKFRVWAENYKMILPVVGIEFKDNKDIVIECPSFQWGSVKMSGIQSSEGLILMQFTGLLDKNGLTEVYECDIIGIDGVVRGNIYETNKEKIDLVIQGFGTSSWETTIKEALARGCKYSE